MTPAGTEAAPRCHLTPGTWRPGAPDQCYHNWAMPQFDFSRCDPAPRPTASLDLRASRLISPHLARYLAQPALDGLPNASLPVDAPRGDRAARLAALGALCRRGAEQSAYPDRAPEPPTARATLAAPAAHAFGWIIPLGAGGW